MTDPTKGSPDRITSTKPRPQRSMDPAVHPDDLGELDGIRDSLTRLYGIVAELERRVAVCAPPGDTERRLRILESAMDAQVRENRVKPSTTEKLGRIEYRLKEVEAQRDEAFHAARLAHKAASGHKRRVVALRDDVTNLRAQRDAYADPSNWQVRDVIESLRTQRLNHLTVRYVGPTPSDGPEGVQPSPSRVTPSMIQDASLEVFRSHGKGVAVFRPDQAAALAAALNRQLHPSDSPEAEEPESVEEVGRVSDKIYTVDVEIDGCRRPTSYRHWSLEEANKYVKCGGWLGKDVRYIVVEWTRGEEREVPDDR